MSEAHSTDFARQLELAWAAGFFDGEGCTTLDVQHSGFSYVRLSIKQVVLENLERFKAAVGGAGTISPAKVEVEGCKPVQKWRVGGTGAREVLQLLWPYLGSAKREQATRVLAAENNKGGIQFAKRTHCPKGHPYDEANTRPRTDSKRNGRRCRACDAELHRAKRKTDKPHPRERTHCPQEHAYAEHGFLNSEGKRVCRICNRETQRRFREKSRETES